MKKLVLTGIASIALALGVQAQGTVDFGNSFLTTSGVAIDTAGAYYTGGAFTIQLWALPGAAVPSGVNDQTNSVAYGNLSSLGYVLVSTYTGTMDGGSAGTFEAGNVQINNIPLHAATAVIALAAWNSADATPTGAADHLGVLSFVNPVGDPNATPVPGFPSLLTGWDASGDLVMTTLTAVPEPTTMALAGLGAAALLIVRRRK